MASHRQAVHDQYDGILDALSEKLTAVAEHLGSARADVLAFSAFPKDIWRQIWNNAPRPGAPTSSRSSPTAAASSDSSPPSSPSDTRSRGDRFTHHARGLGPGKSSARAPGTFLTMVPDFSHPNPLGGVMFRPVKRSAVRIAAFTAATAASVAVIVATASPSAAEPLPPLSASVPSPVTSFLGGVPGCC